MSARRGWFITFEGIEGVGKSTQVALTAQWLRECGEDLLVTREPGGTPLAELMRDLVLKPTDEVLPPNAELLLMFAARAVHLTNRIEPALASNRSVLCDRFTDATYAYQGAGRGIERQKIAALESIVHPALQPDLTLLLDAPVELALARAQGRGHTTDRFELERVEFFRRVRDEYLQRARHFPQRIRIVDASADLDAVQSAIRAAIHGNLKH